MKFYKNSLLFLFICLPFSGFSTHIVGGSLTYVWNGGNSYTVTLKLYKDMCVTCAGWPGTNPTIQVLQPDGSLFNPSKNFVIGTISTTPLTSNLDTCADPPNPIPSVSERIYQSTITLPPNPGGYHLRYAFCCRNTTLTNTDAADQSNPGDGETFYAYIPGTTWIWGEYFNLTNGTTVDNGTTKWSRTLGTVFTAAVQGSDYRVEGASNGQSTWTSQYINIAAYSTGVNLSAYITEEGNLDANDSIRIYYRVNTGALTLFTGGAIANDNTLPATVSQTGVIGDSVQIVVAFDFDGASDNTEKYHIDEITVTSGTRKDNSSPLFTNFPPLFVCQGNNISFNHAATDGDGDSLVYSLYAPYSDLATTYPGNVATFTPVTYLGGYSASNALNSGGPAININSSTGLLTGIPNTLGQFVVGIKCIEYRSGVMMSEMVRDFQFNVVFCPPPAQAGISGTSLTGCRNISYTFPNNSDPAANNWFWDFGVSGTLADTSILKNPSYTYTATGTYTVTLIVNRNTACADTAIQTITISIPSTPIAGNSGPVCSGQTLTLTASTIASATYSWTGPNSFSSSSQNPVISSITTAGSGTYSVTATVGGCTGNVATTAVTVNQTPSAPSAGSNSPICSGQNLLLTASNAGTTYSWTGPNSYTSSTQNPTIVAATTAESGTYSVTATTSGCTGPAGTTTVTVNSIPVAPTAGSNSAICVGATLSLTASTIGGATYSWTGPNSFTSSSQNPTIPTATTAASGTYSVTATVAGCTGPAGVVSVTVSPQPAAPSAGSNTPVCVGGNLSLTASTIGGATYSWTGPNSFSSAIQNPVINGVTALASGTYSVTATVAGCTGSAGTTAVTINPIPSAPTAGSNNPVCAGQTLSLTANTIASATYSWTGPNSFTSSLEDPTIASITTAGTGTYSVTVTVGGCTGPAGTTAVTINPIPSAPTAGSNSPICVGATLSLTASTIAGATYSWTGPNSFTSSLEDPTIASITTAGTGTYSVTVIVAGCTGPAGTTAVIINPIPSAPTAGSNSPMCVGSTLSLTASTIGGATYSWTGPNSFTSSLQNPAIGSVTTLASGTYSVTATVAGCTGSAGTVNVTISPPPVAPIAASNSPMCVGTTLSLTASTIGGATYSWTGPNSFTSSLQNPTIGSVTTLASGAYSVTATVAGCTGPAGTVSVIISPPPVAPTAGSNSPICVGATLSLTASTIASATYSWTGPNSFTSSLQSPTIGSVTTLASGTYSVTATVAGCTGPAGTTVVIINSPPGTPTAGSNSPVCSGQTLSLTASTIASATYSWTGPNSFSSSLQNPTIGSVTTLASGTYSVAVTVAGCTGSSATTAVTINQAPVAPTAGSNSPICVGNNLSLTASVIGGATYSWTGPNSFSSSSQNPTIGSVTTLATGTYSVTATVAGCTGPAGTTAVTVNPIPGAPTAGSNSPLCVGNNLSLTANTIGGATYSWTGPNSFSSSLQNPVINGVTLSAAGTYSVSVTVAGCSGPAGTTAVTVAPLPAAPIAGNNSPVCSGQTLSLTASAIASATYSWTGPNSFSSSLQNPTIGSVTTLASGTYSVVATVAGCPGSAGTTVVTINPIPIAPTAGSNSPICVGGNLSLTANTIGGATYSWTGPNSFSSSSQNPVINGVTTVEAGTYSVNVIVAGCTGPAATTAVIINPPPAAPTAGSNSPVCSGQTLSLTASTIASATYSWTGPNSFSSALQNPTIGSVTTMASGTYSVTATVPGCVTSPAGIVSVIINQSPVAPAAGSNSPVCAGQTLSLTANTIASAAYSWTGPNGFTSSSEDPTITIVTTAASGTYSVTVTVAGCTGPAGTTAVTINPIPSAPTAGSNSPLCVGNNLSLTANTIGGATYFWTGPNSFSSSSQNPVINGVTIVEAGTYSVNVTVSGCAGPAATTAVTVAPPPVAPTAASNSPVCAGITLSLTASTIANATYSWTGPNSFTSSLQNPTIGSVTTAGAGTYSVTATVAGCAGPAGTTIVTINSSPSAPVAGNNGPLCVGADLSLTASTIAGATYSWTGPNSFTSSSQNPVINNITTAESGTYSVTATVAGCTGLAGTTIVIINSPPGSPVAGSNSPVCSGQALSLTASAIAGATYSWTGPNSFSSSSQNPIIGSVTTLASGTYSVAVTVAGCTGASATTAVTINQTPVAPTAGSNSPICAGNDLSLTASTVGSSTYSWSGPNSFSSITQNPVIVGATTAASGTYSVTATENGCTGPAGTIVATINPIPIAPTAGSNSPLCVGNNLSLTTNTIGGATYSWTGPNGFSSFLQNPVINGVTALEAGTYSVSVTVLGCTGPVGTIPVVINLIPAVPVAGSNSPVCSGTTLSLTASTIGGATYSWTGPNGFSSSSQNPIIGSVTTLASGTYSVTATENGCTGSAGTIAVAINQTPSAPVAANNGPLCIGDNLSLTAGTIAGATYAWTGPNSFSSASQNPVINSVTTAEAGMYSVTATVNGCLGTAGTTSVIVAPPPSAPAAGSNSPICSGQTLSLTASTIVGATYIWTGPNGFSSSSQNPIIGSVTTLASGTYSVTATISTCVSPLGTTVVVVNQTPAAPTAGNNSPICAGSDLSLTASAVGNLTYAWTGPNSFSSITQNPVIVGATTAESGTYSVTATENGCTGPAGTTVATINPIPAAPAAGSNSPLCVGSNLSLTASTIAGATYSWTGPNGFSSSSQNPVINSITSLESGTYSVSVTVSGCSGLVGTTAVTVNLIPAAPVAGSNSPICSGNDLSLTASTVGSSTYTWSGPNNFSSITQNPMLVSATTAESGTYSVTATENGCTGSAGTIAVTINQTPSAPVATNNGPLCIGDNLSLTASTIAGATYAWSGPNSFSSASQNPVINNVTTVEAGTYSVTATVNGCLGTAGTTSVIVAPPPSAPVVGSNSPVCSGQTISLTADNIVGASYTWTGPNSFSSITQNPIIVGATTAEAGTYSVTATIGSCVSPLGTTGVVINQTPTAPTAGNNSPICAGNDLSLTASTVGTSTYSWNGPNSFSSTTQNPVIVGATTAESGTYSVTATENGCTGPAGITSVTVNPIPAAPIAGNNGALCLGDNLSLTANTISGATYTWTGPNSFSSSLQNPVINVVTTVEAGTYSVTATVNGCLGLAGTTSVIVAPPPSAPLAGSNSPVCTGQTVSLTAGTITGATYTWSGPNGFSSSIQDPIISNVTSAAAGTYSVIATIGSCTGPLGTTSVSITPSPAAPTAGSSSPGCVGSDLSLTASTVGGATYSWTGPNSFTSALQNPVIVGTTTSDAGTYSVTVSVSGCTGSAGTTLVIINPFPVAPTAGSNSPVCAGTDLSLTASSVTGATSYSWSGPNTFTSSSQNPILASVTAGATGTYSVSAIVPGCPLGPAGTTSVTIQPAPMAPTAGNNGPICSGNDVSLTASTVGSATYTWSGPNGFSSSSQNPTIINATSAHAGTYSVTATENGCAGPAGTTIVTISPIPITTAGNNGPLCIGDNLSLTASSIAGATYTWSGPNGFSSSSQNPIVNTVTTAAAGIYSVTATANGCLGLVGTTTVIVAPPPAAPVAGSNSTICSGQTLSLSASTITGATYSWVGPNSFTSGLQNPLIGSATILASGTYSVTAMIGSCISPVSTTSVDISQSPSAPTAGSNSPLCVGDNLSLTASTVAGATYLWSGPNGFSSSSQDNVINGVTTADAGTYSVSVTDIANGCVSEVSTVSVSITSTAIVNAGADQTVCANNAAPLNGIITGGSGTAIWSTSNGTGIFSPSTSTLNGTYTPNINDTLIGNILLILTSSNNGGCAASVDTLIVHVNPGPVVNAGADQSICANNYATVNINGSVLMAGGGVWSTLGTGTFQLATTVLNNTYLPTSTDSANGSVMLVLSSTGNGSCSPVNDSLRIIFTPAPQVNAGSTILVCKGDSTAELNGIISGGATTGQWSTLGSGTFSPNNTVLNAIYLLSTADTVAGSVSLILTSTNNGNCIAVTDTVTITMTPAPIVAAGNDITVCANNAMVSLNGSITSGSTTGVWSSTGTGIFSPDSITLNATYTPSAADTAAGSITLTLTSTNGCRAVSDSLLVTITNAPIVNAGADVSICEGATVSLNGSVNSSATGGQWTSSGNGIFLPTNSTLNASYIPGSNDTSSVTLVLTSTGIGQCLPVTDSMVIAIGRKPIAGFSYPKICLGQEVTFTDTSAVVGMNDTLVSWNWVINGGNYILQNPSHTYSVAGTDSVILIVTTNIGCSDTVAHVITINPAPVASFTVNSNCSLDSVYFTSTSAISSGVIISWNWDFGDTTTSTVQNPVHSYDSAGVYIVSLTVTSDSGCTATITDTISTIKGIAAGFDYNDSCNLTIGFSDTSLISSGDSIVVWSWNFGDGTSLVTVQNPVHTYINSGMYTVTLAITTAGGCKDTIIDTIYVSPMPVANFAPQTGIYNTGQTIAFTDLSVNASSWLWSFGNEGTDTIQNPSHTFSSNGNLEVSLIITNNLGCSDTAKYTFTFNTNMVGIPTAFTPNGDGKNDVLYVRGGPLKEMDWRIYNEWGNEVFHSTSQGEGWDGNYKGKKQPVTRYVYILQATTYGGEKVDMKGEVTIIR